MNTRGSVTLKWLVQLRWFAVVAQAVLVVAVDIVAPVDVPVGTLLGLLGAVAVSNAVLHWGLAKGKASLKWATAMLAFDVLILTIGLDRSGGPMNPFAFLYVVQVALAAVALRGWAIGMIAVLSIAGYGALYFRADNHQMHHSHEFMELHLDGMWVAMAVTAVIIGYFISVLQVQLHRREDELREMRASRARHDKLDTLTSMAASAAHELATPLGTIAIAAKELSHELDKVDSGLAEDANLIREETRRCQKILKRLSMSSGDTLGEEIVTCSAREVLEEAVSRVSDSSAVSLDVSHDCEVRIPRVAVVESLSAIIQNGIDANLETDGEQVVVTVETSGRSCRLCVEDQGPGIEKDNLDRVTEPFFTTKVEGMGLGLFIAQRLAIQLDGELTLENRETGLSVTLELPVVS